jgi:hypothetical protein
MANKSDRAVGTVEGFSSIEFNNVVAIWIAFIHIYCFSRRPSASFLESLQVSPILSVTYMLHLHYVCVCAPPKE